MGKLPLDNKELIIENFLSDIHSATLKVWQEQEFERNRPGEFDILVDDPSIWMDEEVAMTESGVDPKPKDPREELWEELEREWQKWISIEDFLKHALERAIVEFGLEIGPVVFEDFKRRLFKKGYLHEEEFE